jgi:hypothetical protein
LGWNKLKRLPNNAIDQGINPRELVIIEEQREDNFNTPKNAREEFRKAS